MKKRRVYQEKTLESCFVLGARIFDESFYRLPLVEEEREGEFALFFVCMCVFFLFCFEVVRELERTRDGHEREDGIVKYIFVRGNILE